MKFKPFARRFFSQSCFEKLKMTLLGSCIEMLHLTNLLEFFYWVALFDTKILFSLLRNNKFTWAKSIKLISWCNEEWLELKSFFKVLISDFLSGITSCNNFNLHCLYVKKALRDWLLTRKFKKLGTTEHYHYHELWFAYCNTYNLMFFIIKAWKWTEETRQKHR